MRVLRVFVITSVVLAVLALVAALRAEEVFRRRLEGLVYFTAVGLCCWHALAACLAGAQLPALSALTTTQSPAAWQRFVRVYSRTWLIASLGLAVMVALFLLTLAFIHLERGFGPPR